MNNFQKKINHTFDNLFFKDNECFFTKKLNF